MTILKPDRQSMFCFEHAQTYDGIKMLMEPHCVSLLLYQVFSSPLM